MIHCLHICNDFLGSGVYTNLYGALDGEALKQTVFHPYRNKSRENVEEKIKDFKNLQVIYSKPLKKWHSIFFRAKINYSYNDLVTQITDLRTVDIVHATTLFSDGALALKLYKKFGIPYIVNIRSTDISVYLKLRKDLYSLGSEILNNAKAIIFVSNSLKKKFFEHQFALTDRQVYELKSDIIYNGIANFWHNNKQGKKKETSGKLLYIGTFINRKNALLTANSVLGLNDAGEDFTISFIGSGGALEEEIKELAVAHPSQIFYQSKIKEKKKLRDAYRNHDILILPSLAETFGLVYIEALSQGIPVIFCKNEGIDLIFNKSIGEACEPNIESIQERILELYRNYKDYDLEAFDLSLFDWKQIANKYYKLYQPTT